MGDENKDAKDASPKRSKIEQRFEKIQSVDYSKQREAADRLRGKVNRDIFSSNTRLRPADHDALTENLAVVSRELAIVAETMHECAQVLGVNEVPISLVTYPKKEDGVTFMAITGENLKDARLEVNFDVLQSLGQNFDNDEMEQEAESYNRSLAKQQLRHYAAAEIYHLAIMKNYPSTDQRTLEANQQRGQAYLEDRGERATNAFADRYVLYKSGHDSSPEQVFG